MTASAKGTAKGEEHRLRRRPDPALRSGLRRLRRDRVRSRPDHLRLRQVGLRTGPAAGRRLESKPADVSACQEAATGLEVGDFVDNLSNEGSADVDGTGTTKVSGDLNVGAAIDAIIKLTENPACSSQLEAAGPLPIGELEKAKGELTSAVKKAHVEVYVGDDNIIRKLAAELTIEPKGTTDEKVEVDFELSLGGVNEEQDISAPAGAKPLEGLFQKLGVNPIELLEGVSSGEGLGGLLEGVTGGGIVLGGRILRRRWVPSGGVRAARQQAYLECLEGAETPADLQQCASMIQ